MAVMEALTDNTSSLAVTCAALGKLAEKRVMAMLSWLNSAQWQKRDEMALRMHRQKALTAAVCALDRNIRGEELNSE